MKINYSNVVATELAIKEQQVKAVISLLEEGGTVPFIARYRKEATGSLDEVAIAKIPFHVTGKKSPLSINQPPYRTATIDK